MIYKRNGLVFTSLKDPHWSDPKIARIIPRNEDSWGDFKEIQDTEWEKLIPSVSEKNELGGGTRRRFWRTPVPERTNPCTGTRGGDVSLVAFSGFSAKKRP